MTANELLMWIGIALGVIALIGIAGSLWAACALSGRIDDEHGLD